MKLRRLDSFLSSPANGQRCGKVARGKAGQRRLLARHFGSNPPRRIRRRSAQRRRNSGLATLPVKRHKSGWAHHRRVIPGMPLLEQFCFPCPRSTCRGMVSYDGKKGSKSFIYATGVMKHSCHFWIENGNVRSFGILLGVFTPHAVREVVLLLHVHIIVSSTRFHNFVFPDASHAARL